MLFDSSVLFSSLIINVIGVLVKKANRVHRVMGHGSNVINEKIRIIDTIDLPLVAGI